MTNTKQPKESSLKEQYLVEVAEEEIKTQESTATGNDKISIIGHKHYSKYGENNRIEQAGVELSIKNISDTTIGSAIFETEFYDRNGNIIDKAEHSEFELSPNTKGRTIYIASSHPELDKIESYSVKLIETTMPPKPTATGNEKIAILKHRLSETQLYANEYKIAVNMAIKNISDSTIATMIFEAEFFDRDGNISEKVKHNEIDLQPLKSRGISICSKKLRDINEIRSYSVKIVKMTTADIERIQICREEMRTTENGEVDIIGSVKNISEVKTDVSLVATFFDNKNEKIGVKVIIIKDIEPRNIKHFNIVFKPIEGDIFASYDLQPVYDIESV